MNEIASTRRALAIDLDGTLLVGETLSVRSKIAVKRAFDAGYEVIIATARWRQMATRIAAEIGLIDTPIIACSGAQVFSQRKQQDVYDVRLPIEFVRLLYQICNDNRCIASATVDGHSWLKLDQAPDAEYLSEELRWVQQLPMPTPGLPSDLPRIATVQGTGTIKEVRALQAARFSEDVNIFDSIGPSGKIVITITSKQADKGIALREVCRHESIALENVIAFGDADNDIAMFQYAGRSVAMGQAEDRVKQAATFVTATNIEDGVAKYIEENLL
jgi:Cof subfamily protein (haloacid dehalogenase superfamily)